MPSVILDGPMEEGHLVHHVVGASMENAAPAMVREVVPILVDHEVSTTSWAEKVPYAEVFD